MSCLMTSKEYNLPVSLGCQNTADSKHKPHSQVLRSRKCNSNYSQKPYGEEKDIIALWRQLPSLLYFEAQVQRTDKSHPVIRVPYGHGRFSHTDGRLR